ncbi:MAG: hypothetical protein HLUCCA11_06950 [Phormidesmis priestleyi Ana]|uniref:Uncharacterized protein n=1 Tax=Phormidesmis priestleyi Ana TaxID=1666911 RepID=A0A0P8BQK6_9CYAN|nr:MAG: hypothetical protein HLUCCA11_06950 [Phormidesmis priestleyi Ana]
MASATRQQILVGFGSEQALQQAHSQLREKSFSTLRSAVIPPLSKSTPQQRTIKKDTPKAAGLGGVIGLSISGLIFLAAQGIPNQSSIQNYPGPLLAVFLLVGAFFGALGVGLISFFAGARPTPPPTADHQLEVEASTEEVKAATQILLNAGGRLL